MLATDTFCTAAGDRIRIAQRAAAIQVLQFNKRAKWEVLPTSLGAYEFPVRSNAAISIPELEFHKRL